jgi:hypothetical protein
MPFLTSVIGDFFCSVYHKQRAKLSARQVFLPLSKQESTEYRSTTTCGSLQPIKLPNDCNYVANQRKAQAKDCGTNGDLSAQTADCLPCHNKRMAKSCYPRLYNDSRCQTSLAAL